MTYALRDVECALCGFIGSQYELMFHDCYINEDKKSNEGRNKNIHDKIQIARG